MAAATSITAATAKRLLLYTSLPHLSKSQPQQCVARTAVRTLTVAARAPSHPPPSHLPSPHPYEAALPFTAAPPPPHLVLQANHSTSVMSAARPNHNVIDNNEDPADAKLYGWGVLAVLLGANALAIWCELKDENSYLRSLATLRKAQAVQQENEESDIPGWRPQRRRTKILHFTWPGASTKQ